jgi:Putative prokaryotic signal transducing protein
VDVTRQSLAEYYDRLNDDELQRLFHSGELTSLAMEVATEELRRRGIDVAGAESEGPPSEEEGPPTERDETSSGGLVLLARYASPMEAEIVCARVAAEGVFAVVADAHIVQMTGLMSYAFGGVRVLVLKSQLAQAREILERT